MHTNVVIFGFIGTALLGSAFYLVPTLLRTPFTANDWGNSPLWFWNLSIASGTVTLALGYSQGREYAEWIWPVDMGVLLTFALIFYNLFRTAGNRREKTFYVSIWYIFAGLIYLFLIYFFGNAVWNPSYRGHYRPARCRPGLVLRPRRGGPVPDPPGRCPCLLHDSRSSAALRLTAIPCLWSASGPSW